VSQPKKPAKSVTLKRSVTIKALVTPKFREFISFELASAIQSSKDRQSELENVLSNKAALVAELGEPAVQAFETELAQVKLSLQELAMRESSLNELEDGSIFDQGIIDGFVSVSEGDNLYEKLGGMEILVKDGVVQSITPVPQVQTPRS